MDRAVSTALNIAEVVVSVPSKNIDKVFDYLIPDELVDEVQVGSRVQVPFASRQVQGFVMNTKDFSLVQPRKLKPLTEVMDQMPSLTPELVDLGVYMAQEYMCHMTTALSSMVPAVLRGKSLKSIRLYPGSEGKENILPFGLHELLRQKGEITWEEALQIPGMDARRLRNLKKQQAIWVKERVYDRVMLKKVTWVYPMSKELQRALDAIPSNAMQQQKILRFFLDHPNEVELPRLLSAVQAPRSAVKRLVEKGWLKWEERETYRDLDFHQTFTPTQPLSLTEEQRRAFTPIAAALTQQQFSSFLLQGVTGSGKTEIYLQLISQVLEQGQEAIVLVPEISLTPQMVERFKGRFGPQVAVLHSGLSSGERYDEWRKIRRGEVKVAIGVRSAIFAPFENLGIIIIDEEHEPSYKQDENPRYHARDVGLWRAKRHQAVLLLGSATPALQTYYLAKTGYHKRVSLTTRVQDRPFPRVEIVDMREELKAGNRSIFSYELRQSLLSCIGRGEQAVLFLNRRGFSTFVICRSCGERLTCQHCDISLTFHQTNQTVRCHYCGFAKKLPPCCPACQSKHIRRFGIGTQRVEEELLKCFPGIKVIRMDVDTTRTKGAHERLLSSFGKGEADVLLGTQMIAKGLDFPKVTLVGVIAADAMLFLPDFKAAERTFQLLTQVSGRAGRHEKPGKVVVQTYNTNHYSIQMAATHQIESFYQRELMVREQHSYPPFCHLYIILVSYEDQIHLARVSRDVLTYLRPYLGDQSEVFGPSPAGIPRIKDRYRMQILIKCHTARNVQQPLREGLRQLTALYARDGVQIHIGWEGFV